MVHEVSLRLHKVSWVDIFYGQRVFLTKRGYFGVGAPGLLEGDIVSVRVLIKPCLDVLTPVTIE
jgi:hypothetical protein